MFQFKTDNTRHYGRQLCKQYSNDRWIQHRKDRWHKPWNSRQNRTGFPLNLTKEIPWFSLTTFRIIPQSASDVTTTLCHFQSAPPCTDSFPLLFSSVLEHFQLCMFFLFLISTHFNNQTSGLKHCCITTVAQLGGYTPFSPDHQQNSPTSPDFPWPN